MTTQHYKRRDTSNPNEGEAGLPNRNKFQAVSTTIPRIPISSEDIDSELNTVIDAVNELFDLGVAGVVPDNTITLAKLTHQNAGELYSFSATGVPEMVAKGTDGQVLTANTSGAPAFIDASVNPSGVIVPFAGSSAPSGWLLADGAAVSRTTYANLFATISTTYGVGDGSTTFNVPDLRGRIPAGLDNMGSSSANRITSTQADNLGGVIGSEDHTLTLAETPAHRHLTMNLSASSSGALSSSNQATFASAGGLGNSDYRIGNTSADSNVGRTNSQGGGDAHSILQPTIFLNHIIKA